MDNIVQVRLSDDLRERLERVAERLEMPLSTLIRTILASFAKKPEMVRLTENGFTVEEEDRILRSLKATEKAIEEGKVETFRSVDEALQSLEQEIRK
ncbi:hypothetical protein HYW54_01795 [Candidatus Gottesmanbacteria bacterium]|nr:hypothetical protein [Candidatus Gottesmanbacteria bacterium]